MGRTRCLPLAVRWSLLFSLSQVNNSCENASNGTEPLPRASKRAQEKPPILKEAMVPRARIALLFVFSLLFTASLPAQVTHGQKPKLPAPFETKSAGNGPRRDKPPAGFLPTVPDGFRISVFAANFKYPRWLTIAPNGDIFLAVTGAGQIVVLRETKEGGEPQREVFVEGMRRPFGIAFHDEYVYVGNTNELVRFRYDPKTSKRLGEKEHLMSLPSGGHDTRTLAFSPDGKHLFIAVGSGSNINTGEP